MGPRGGVVRGRGRAGGKRGGEGSLVRVKIPMPSGVQRTVAGGRGVVGTSWNWPAVNVAHLASWFRLVKVTVMGWPAGAVMARGTALGLEKEEMGKAWRETKEETTK